MSDPDSLEEQVAQELAELWRKYGHEQPFGHARLCYHWCCMTNSKTCDCRTPFCTCCGEPPPYQPGEEPGDDWPWEPVE